jgi:hypothetical protein
MDQKVVDFIVAAVPERNAILHGQSRSFGRPQLSAQVMFLVYALALSVATREGGFVPREAAYRPRRARSHGTSRRRDIRAPYPAPNTASVTVMSADAVTPSPPADR